MRKGSFWGAIGAAILFGLTACEGGREITTLERSAQLRADDVELSDAVNDVVVIAVIDSSINPYHFDYLSAHMPQHLNEDPSDDLPLDRDPAEWLPGHPGADAFASYTKLKLSLDADNEFQSSDVLHTQDQLQWGQIQYSEGNSNDQVHMYWMPGTKIIGHVAFPGSLIGDPVTSAVLGPQTGSVDTYASSSHGIGTSSVSAGNIHGSCPNCLLVYVHGTSEQANEWVAKQDWIDLQTNSWGASTVYRERAYAGSDTELQRETVERGQSIFFSAGNGQGNAFVVPNTTLLSSQEGPDWIVTVGAISPGDNSSYSGHGKPSDLAGIGSGYPSATNGNGTVSGEGNFSGTSNATPVVAGMYGQALYELRRSLPGPSRMQQDGVIAVGDMRCGPENAQCALADGQLTVHEMREALFRAAQYTATGWNVGGAVTIPQSENYAEAEFVAEGHGSFIGRLNGDEHYRMEVERIVGFALGDWYQEPDAEQQAWFAADAHCRQSIWGAWEFGEDQKAPVPAADPNWPTRSFLSELCPVVLPPIAELERAYASLF